MSGILHTWVFMLEDFNRMESLVEWALALGLGSLAGGGILLLWDWLVT